MYRFMGYTTQNLGLINTETKSHSESFTCTIEWFGLLFLSPSLSYFRFLFISFSLYLNSDLLVPELILRPIVLVLRSGKWNGIGIGTGIGIGLGVRSTQLYFYWLNDSDVIFVAYCCLLSPSSRLLVYVALDWIGLVLFLFDFVLGWVGLFAFAEST